MSSKFEQALDRAVADSMTGLNSREHSLCTLATLIAVRADPAMIARACATAREPDGAACQSCELEDVIVQMAAYVGFAAAAPAIQAAHAALGSPAPAGQSREPVPLPALQSRYEVGATAYRALDGSALDAIESAFGEIGEPLIEETFCIFGDVYASSTLPRRERQLATVGCLAAVGTAQPQLQFHLGVAISLGIEVETLVAVLRVVQVHAGIPAAYNGLIALKAAIHESRSGSTQPVYT